MTHVLSPRWYTTTEVFGRREVIMARSINRFYSKPDRGGG